MALRSFIACVSVINLPLAVQGATCPTGKQVKGYICSGTAATDCSESACCEWNPTTSCNSWTVAAGYKLKTNAAAIYCASATCSNANCLDLDTTKCGGVVVTCTTANTYYDSSKAGVAHGSDHNANCCSTKALCNTLTCSAGYKSKTNAASTYCSSKTCTIATDGATCCDADTTKCGGVVVTCTTANTYYDSSKAGVAH